MSENVKTMSRLELSGALVELIQIAKDGGQDHFASILLLAQDVIGFGGHKSCIAVVKLMEHWHEIQRADVSK